MKTIKVLFVLILLGGVGACKKKDTSVKVKVFNEVTQQYKANKQVHLFETDNGNYGVVYFKHISATILKTVFTDANGEADFGSFDVKRSNRYDYHVCQSDNVYLLGIKANTINKGSGNSVVLKINNYPHLSFDLSPAPPYNTGDSLRIDFYNPEYCSANSCHNIITDRNIYSQNYVSIFLGTYYFNIDKYKNGVYTNTKDTIDYLTDDDYTYTITW